MKFIFSTGSLYSYSLDRVFAFAAEAGYDGVELMVDDRWDTRQADFLQGLIQQHSLPILAVHSPFRPVVGWGEARSERIERAVELAESVGAGVVIHHLPKTIARISFKVGYRKELRLFNPLGELERDYRLWLEEGYQRLQQRTDVALCIENMPAQHYLGMKINGYTWNADNRESLSQLMRFPTLTMDTTHLGTWGLDPTEVYAHWGQRVRHVHFSNFDGQREHRRPEDGILKLEPLLARMANENYDGCISLELHPDAIEGGAADEVVVEHMTKSLGYCRQWANL